MSSLAETYGMLRSILMYYAVPFRTQKLLRFYSNFIHPGDLCYDIGAHVGSRIRIWSRLGARVVAVEPQPKFLTLLRRWYGQKPGITLLGCALGAEPGEGTLLISQRTPTVTTLSPEWTSAVRKAASFAGVRWDASMKIPIMTLDALIDQYGEPAFCKIDVEGYEFEVLKGLSRPVNCLSFEFIPAVLDLSLSCIERLEQLDHYEFNYARGESMRLHLDAWTSGEQVSAHLKTFSKDSRSGDIYARRKTLR